MDELNSKVLRAFNVKPVSVVKEKGSYKVQLKDGSRVIRRTDLSAEYIEFQHEIKEYLFSHGYKSIDRFYCSFTGKPFMSFDGNKYTMTDYIKYPEACFANKSEFIDVIKSTAVMHNILKDSELSEKKMPVIRDDLISDYERSINRLKKIKAGLNIEKRLSDLDVMFIKNYESYIKNIEDAAELLQNSDYTELLEESIQNKGIRHNGIREENIFLNKEDVYITNFSQASIGYYIFDLESLIKRYAKNLPPSHLQISEIISIYNEYNPVKKEDLIVLSAILKYPQKFIKICGQYYNKRYSFIPGSIYEQMKREIEGRGNYEVYLSNFVNSDWDNIL